MINIESQQLFFTGGTSVNVIRPLTIERGLTVVVGPNGSGKTLFAGILEKGWNFRTNRISSISGIKPIVRYMAFNDIHAWVGFSVGHYQQRYEAAMNDEVPTVRKILGDRTESALFRKLAESLKLSECFDKKINFLSSGELRKLLIINVLHEKPDLLILDNPYIGLDPPSRESVNETLRQLVDDGQSVMLLLSDGAEAPLFTDHRIYVDNLRISTEPFQEKRELSMAPLDFRKEMPVGESEEVLVRLEKCNVTFGSKVIIENLDWEIRSGEKWSLSGPNGSGKSTLLSLIYADNPKSYSNDITLFGRRRGSGESIWDIKREIGFVSPEMQLHFHGSGTVEQIIANGYNDTVGLFVKPTCEQLARARQWLDHFGLIHLAQRSFMTLSSGERQMVLVIRSMIKEPRLLILDEPMHALDPVMKHRLGRIIEEFTVAHPRSAMIFVTHNESELPSSVTHHLKLSNHAS